MKPPVLPSDTESALFPSGPELLALLMVANLILPSSTASCPLKVFVPASVSAAVPFFLIVTPAPPASGELIVALKFVVMDDGVAVKVNDDAFKM